MADLHLRACRWFAGQGEPIAAIRHAGHARRWDEVGRLLTARGLPLILTASRPALIAALAPAAARARVDPTAGTLLAAAVCHYHRHDYDEMARDAGDAAALMDSLPAEDRHAAAALIATLRVVRSRTHDPVTLTPAAAALMDLLDDVPRQQLPAAEQYRVIATNNIALGQLWAGDLTAAETTLAVVQTRCADMGLGLVELSAQAHLALLDAIHGRLPDAADRAEAGQRVAERRGWVSEPQALALYAAHALTAIATHRLDVADANITAGLAVSNGGSDIACRLTLAIAAVEVEIARHDPAAARAADTRLRDTAAPVRCAAADAGPVVRGRARRHVPGHRTTPGSHRPPARPAATTHSRPGSRPPWNALPWPKPDCCCTNPTPRSTCWAPTLRRCCRSGDPRCTAGSWPPSRPTKRTAGPLPWRR